MSGARRPRVGPGLRAPALLLLSLAAVVPTGLGGGPGLRAARAEEPPPALPAPGPAPAPAPSGEASDPALGADPAAAAAQLLVADALADEGRWGEAAEAYWKARKANLVDYRTHVRYQEMCLKAGDKHDDLVKDYTSLTSDYAGHFPFRLHRLRLEAPAARRTALEALLGERPQDGDVLLELVATLLDLGDLPAAQKALTTGQALVPSARADEALFLAAEIELGLGLKAEARKRVAALLTSRPDHRGALLLTARLDLLEGRVPEALAGARKVLEGRPLHLAARLLLSEALMRSDKRDEAITALEEPLRVVKDVPELLLALGDLTARLETDAGYTKALELYERVLAAPSPPPAAQQRARYGKAWVLERQLKWKEAEELYRKVLSADASDVRALHSVGFCAMKQGRVSESQVQFRKALDLQPQFLPAVLDLAATYDLQADYATALKHYEKVLKTKGWETNLRALVNAAFDHEALAAFPKATELLLKAHKVAPEDVDIVVWLGDNAYFKEEWKPAEKWYQKAVTMDPKAFFGWRGLGFTLGHLKRWPDAAAALEKAREIKPADKDVLLALGDIYMSELEDYEKAVAAFEAYVQAGGDDPAIPELITELRNLIASK